MPTTTNDPTRAGRSPLTAGSGARDTVSMFVSPRARALLLAVTAIAVAMLLVACGNTSPGGATSGGPGGGPSGGPGGGMAMGGGMMGGAAAGAGVAPTAVAPDVASRLGAAVPAGATADRPSNTLTFSGVAVDLVVLAAPSDGPDETFRVAGMTNPTIVVPRGAHVTVELVNADAGMPHDWLVTTAAPPYPDAMMMGPPLAFDAATPTLAEASKTAMLATVVTFDAGTPGRYTYLCSVPGHAQEGMYGALVVTSS